jgi:hypothetical protein
MRINRNLLIATALLALAGCSTEAQPETGVDSSATDLHGPGTSNGANLAAALGRAVSGPITVTSGQSIRLSAVQPVLGTPGALPPDPCRVELSFVDATGQALANSRVEVGVGVAQHLDFSPSATPSTNANGATTSVTIVPIVAALALATREHAPACLYSVELLDKTSGKSSLVSAPKLLRALDGASLLRELEESAHPVALEFGFVTLARGQTARLNLVNRGLPGLPPDPCRAELAFVDASGAKLNQTEISVAPHEGTTFELSADKLGANGVSSLRPVISAIGNGALPPDPCRVASLEVIDDATGTVSAREEPALIAGERDSELSAPSCPVLSTNGVCPGTR